MIVVKKDPDAVLDYHWDWKPLTNGSTDPDASDWLVDGETIIAHTVTVPDGITKDSSALELTSTGVVVWLSGGTAGQHYSCVCHITTSAGREDDRTIKVHVLER